MKELKRQEKNGGIMEGKWLKYFKWFVDECGDRCVSRKLHLPIRHMLMKQSSITMLFPFCFIAIIYYVVANIIISLYNDIYIFGHHIDKYNELKREEIRFYQFQINDDKLSDKQKLDLVGKKLNEIKDSWEKEMQGRQY